LVSADAVKLHVSDNGFTGAVQAQGRIDVEHPRNAESHYPEGAYSPVQAALHQLEGLVEVHPAAYEHYKHVYDSCQEYAK
jgi:hypothetical protein